MALLVTPQAGATNIQIYGTWHCGNDACTWGTVRNMTDFDTQNHWIIDRGDGVPSVNLVVLTFVNPLNSCQGGVGVGARTLSVPLPMSALRQQ